MYDGAMAGLQRGLTPDPLGHGKALAGCLIQHAVGTEQDRGHRVGLCGCL
ncbi:hypothetical protein ACFYWO_14530 [Streptomyces sp. NPDC002932]